MLHAGIIAGRRSFGNVLKYLLMGTSSNFGNMFSMAGAALFLPFLPMLPTQILLNNFLYDFAQITIPTDNIDPIYVRRPQRWNIALIRNFMLIIGPVSSLYDFLTFFVLLRVFHFGEVPLPHRLVPRVARDADPGALRDPHRGQALDEPTEPAARRDDAARRRDRRSRFPTRGQRVRSASSHCRRRTCSFSAWRWPTYLGIVEVVKERVVRRLLVG